MTEKMRYSTTVHKMLAMLMLSRYSQNLLRLADPLQRTEGWVDSIDC